MRATGVALRAAEEALAAVVAVVVTRQAASPLFLLSSGHDCRSSVTWHAWLLLRCLIRCSTTALLVQFC